MHIEFRHRLYNFLIMLFLCAGSVSFGQTITTVAGTGVEGTSGGGLAVNAQFRLPTSVFADSTGNVYIADTGSHRIHKISTTGIITTIAGTTDQTGSTGDGGAATSALLNSPSGVFADSIGNVYIADTDNHRIRKIDAASSIIANVAGSGVAGFFDTTVASSARFSFPSGVAADKVGNVYVADTGNHRIRKIFVTGGGVTTIAGSGTPGFSGDNGPARAAQLSSPSSVFVDTAGNIFVADTNNHCIRKIAASDSAITTVAGTGQRGFAGDGGPATSARLAFPAAVFVARDSSIYIADRFNQRIRRVNPTGDIITLAGNGAFDFSGDNVASNRATVANPSGLFVDASDNIYIADTGHYRIRKISSDDVISPANRNLTNNGTIGPSAEVRILGVSFTGDGETSVNSLTFTLSAFADTTDLSQADFAEFRLYESTDDTLNAGDTRIGLLDSSQVALGDPSIIQANPPPRPDRNVTRRYLLSAVISRDATQGRAFKIGFPTGGLATSKGGWGSKVVASNADTVGISAIATRLAFTTQPTGALSGNPLLTQPVVTALDDSGFVDFEFTSTVRLSPTGTGSLLHNSVVADSGVATFTNLIYTTTADDESFTLTANVSGDTLTGTSHTFLASVANDPPVVDFPSLELREDDTIGFRTLISNIATDPDDSDLTITFTSKHILASISGDSIIVLSEPDWTGTDTLIITVTDPFGLQSSDSSIIKVTPTNDPPRLDLPSSFSFPEDDTLQIDLRSWVEDSDDAFVDLAWTFIPSTGLLPDLNNATGKLSLWASPDAFGQFSLIAQVRDPLSLVDIDTVRIDITSVNDPPQLSVPDTILIQGEALNIDLRSLTTDVDHDLDQITWTYISTGGTGVIISPAGVATIRPSPGFSGVDTLYFSAIDADRATTSDTTVVKIPRVNQSPILASIPDTAIAPGASLIWDLAPFATDPDDPLENLSWSASGASQSQVSMEGSVLTLQTHQDANLVETLQITVFDLFGFSVSTSLNITVKPPLIAGVPDVSFEIGRILEMPLLPYLRDDILAVTPRANDHLQVIINPSTRLATIGVKDSWKGQTEIILQATGLQGETATDTFQVSVLNPPPSIIGFPAPFLDAGLSIELTLDTYIRDDEPLSRLTWSALPDPGLQVSINSALHIATIAADSSAAGRLQVIFTATDAQEATATDTLRITVHPVSIDTSTTEPTEPTEPTDTTSVNRAPEIVEIPPLEFHRGTFPQFLLDRYVGDDGPLSALSWTATVEPDSLIQVDIDPDRVATVTALQNTGTVRILFRVTDAQGLSASRTVQVNVLPFLDESPPGDFSQDGKVDYNDFFRFADALGLTSLHPEWNPIFDLNEDGMVGFDDFFLFVDLFEEANKLPNK